jgi:hypothetical protein
VIFRPSSQKMFGFSLLTRRLPQRLPTVTLSTLATRSSPSLRAPKSNDISTQERDLHTDFDGTESQGEASKRENCKVYRNSHEEEIVFSPCDPPPGYVFVPSGNVFITRNCRKLAQKLYAVYRNESRKKQAAQIGLHVPRDAFKKVLSEFKAKRARIEGKLWRVLDKEYPQIPSTDKNELHRLISSRYSSLTGTSALDHSELTIYAYVRDRYTGYGENWDTDANARAHQKAQEILASWRGDDQASARVYARRGWGLGQ